MSVDKPLGKYAALYNPEYLHYIQAWQSRAAKAFHGNIGYVDGFAVHHFHGPIVKRGYGTRDSILIDNDYSPVRDVLLDWQGVLQLTNDKPRLKADIRKYFLSRSEDEAHRSGK